MLLLDSLAGILGASIAVSAAAAEQGPPSVPPSQIDEVFTEWNKGSSPGCALAVVKEGEPEYTKGYGMANLDHDVRITPSSVFHVASLSPSSVRVPSTCASSRTPVAGVFV